MKDNNNKVKPMWIFFNFEFSIIFSYKFSILFINYNEIEKVKKLINPLRIRLAQ